MVILLIKKQLYIVTDYTGKTTLKLPIQKEISKDDSELSQACTLQGMVRGRQRCKEKGGSQEKVTGPPAACVLFEMPRERVGSGDGMIQLNEQHAYH